MYDIINLKGTFFSLRPYIPIFIYSFISSIIFVSLNLFQYILNLHCFVNHCFLVILVLGLEVSGLFTLYFLSNSISSPIKKETFIKRILLFIFFLIENPLLFICSLLIIFTSSIIRCYLFNWFGLTTGLNGDLHIYLLFI